MLKDYLGKDFSSLKDKRLFLFDMDGTIYLGNRLFDGVKELLDSITSSGGRYVFITNNSSKSVTDYVKKLDALKIKTTEENFFTSSQAAAMLFKEKFGEKLIYCQGSNSFILEMKSAGLNVTESYDEKACAILVGFDTSLTAEKMFTTSKMLTVLKDAPYYATNPDWVCPVEFGYIPDCGSMCFGYEKATGRAPIFIGKPQPDMINTVCKKFGVDKSKTVVLGDRLYTDIASGVNAGVDTVLVLSGEATIYDYNESSIKPTFVLESVDRLNELK